MNAAQPLGTWSETRLRNRLNATLNTQKLFEAIDSDPELVGAGVVYVDSMGTKVELRGVLDGPICRAQPIKVILREPPRTLSTGLYVSPLEHAADIRTNTDSSRMLLESLNAGLSCTAAVLGWIVVLGSATTVPLSGGASGVVTFFSYSAATASTVQCVNGLARVQGELFQPSRNDWLDDQSWYNAAMNAVDLISLGGAVGSGLATLRSLKLLKLQGGSVSQALRGMSRAERRRLTTEIIRSNHPGASNGMIKAMRRAGQYPSRYTNRQIRQATILQIKDAVGAGASALGSITGGVTNSLAMGIYEVVTD